MVISCWYVTHVRLIFESVEEVREETFLLLGEPKRFRKGRERHLKKKERISEQDVVVGRYRHGQDLGSVDHLVWKDTLTFQFVQDEVRVVR